MGSREIQISLPPEWMELTANSPKSSDACSLRRKTIPRAHHLRDSRTLDPDPTLMLTLTNRDHLTSTLMLTPTASLRKPCHRSCQPSGRQRSSSRRCSYQQQLVR